MEREIVKTETPIQAVDTNRRYHILTTTGTFVSTDFLKTALDLFDYEFSIYCTMNLADMKAHVKPDILTTASLNFELGNWHKF